MKEYVKPVVEVIAFVTKELITVDGDIWVDGEVGIGSSEFD